jgi:hypothetical protein
LSAPALTRPTAPPRTADPNAGLPANALGKEKGVLEQLVLYVFVVVPFLALAAIVPAAWGWGLSWLDVGLGVGFYFLTLLGVTVGYHRYFTHGSFKAVRPLRLALAAIGCMAIQGPVVQWVADHRRHHAYSDREGDPHSPWRYGDNARALVKGMFHAHLGWLFDRRQTNAERYAPDLLKDNGLRITSRLFSFWAFLSFALPTVNGRLVGVLLGRPRAGGIAAPRDLVDQLGLPRRRQPALHRPRQGDQLLAAGDPERRGVLAQPAPRRPDLRPARRPAGADRHQRPGHLAVREGALGERREVARSCAARRQAAPGLGRGLT